MHAHVIPLNIGTQTAELFFESTVDQKKFRAGGPYRILSQVLSFRALFFASGLVCSQRNKNKILYYTRDRPKRVTSWRAHHCACRQHSSFRGNVAAVMSSWQDLNLKLLASQTNVLPALPLDPYQKINK